jgi:predicted transcriptional regulator
MTSEEFKKVRISIGITQDELARIMDMKQPHIARIESGTRQPTKTQAAFIKFIKKYFKD